MTRLADKIVWVTGASSGIGAALAVAAADRGARLILSARRSDLLEEVRRGCRDQERHLVVPMDLENPASIDAAVALVGEHLDRVDVVIHNGGVSQRSLAAETGIEVDRRLMETNYFGTIELTKALLPGMLKRGAGHFVVVTSLVAKFGSPLRSAYAASKHALHGFFDSLRAETWSRGLRVTLVCPGFIRTELPLVALTADGSPQGTMDRAQLEGYPADRCAEKILKAVERNKEEVLVGGKEINAVYFKRFLPRVFSRVIRRIRVT